MIVENNQHDYMVKTIIVGESGVGKTRILKKLLNNDNLYQPSIGVDLKWKEYSFQTKDKENKYIKLQLWDTAGSEKYCSIIKSIYRDAHIVIIVFAIDDFSSFEKLQNWIEKINENIQDKSNIIRFLVANKKDLEYQRTVDKELVQQFLQREYFDGYQEISVFNQEEVAALFDNIIKVLVDKIQRRAINVMQTRSSFRLKQKEQQSSQFISSIGCGTKCAQC